MCGGCKNNGYAFIGVVIFLTIAMILWLGVARQIETYLRIEKNFQVRNKLRQQQDTTTCRALSWGLSLLEVNVPPQDPYACRVEVGLPDDLQWYVIDFEKIADDPCEYRITVHLADEANMSLPVLSEDYYP